MRFPQATLPAFALCLLASCNMAVSRQPVFSERDEATLKLKDGLWIEEESECSFNSLRPVRQWPDCANAALVEGAQVRGAKPVDDADRYEFKLIKGTPAIVQIRQTSGAHIQPNYYYLAANPQQDSGGEVVALSWWSVQCGTEKQGDDRLAPAIQPFAGFNDQCEPASAAVLRQAALRSTSDGKARWRWLRSEP